MPGRHRRILPRAEDYLRRRAIALFGPENTFLTERRVRKVWAGAVWPLFAVKKPIFVWGAGRTGSHLLFDLLSLHPDVWCARRFERRRRGLYPALENGAVHDYDFLLANPFPPVEAVKMLILEPLPEIKHQGHWTKDQESSIKRAFQRLAASSFTQRRLLDKAPHYTFLVPLLEELFPDAFHIHCVRHPVAVVRSYLRCMREPDSLDEFGFWGWRPEGWEAVQDRSLEERAFFCATATMRRGLENAALLGNRCTMVRYEELTQSPRAELKRTLDYLQLAPQPELEARLPERFERSLSASLDGLQLEEASVYELERLVHELAYV